MKNGVSSDCNTKSTSLSACHPVTNKAITKGGNYMEEVWKPVKGYEGLYEVSNTGKVRSLDRTIKYTFCGKKHLRTIRGTVLKQKANPEYYRVSLCKNGVTRNEYVHRIVAEAFIPNPNGLAEVNHIDEDKANNNAENLEWITRLGNVRHGTGNARSAVTRSKPIAQYTLDGILVKVYRSLSEIKREHGWAITNISNAARGHGDCKHPYGFDWHYVSEIDARESI